MTALDVDIKTINKYIAQHGDWKRKLNAIINEGKTEVQPAEISKDNRCEFGKWLEEMRREGQPDEHVREISELHAEFHKKAGDVVRLVNSGDLEAARASMANQGTFALASGELTLAMMRWKKAL